MIHFLIYIFFNFGKDYLKKKSYYDIWYVLQKTYPIYYIKKSKSNPTNCTYTNYLLIVRNILNIGILKI